MMKDAKKTYFSFIFLLTYNIDYIININKRIPLANFGVQANCWDQSPHNHLRWNSLVKFFFALCLQSSIRLRIFSSFIGFLFCVIRIRQFPFSSWRSSTFTRTCLRFARINLECTWQCFFYICAGRTSCSYSWIHNHRRFSRAGSINSDFRINDCLMYYQLVVDYICMKFWGVVVHKTAGLSFYPC